jgi:hypothetical protein
MIASVNALADLVSAPQPRTMPGGSEHLDVLIVGLPESTHP